MKIKLMTESTNMDIWKLPNWKISPYYVMSLERSISPPVHRTALYEIPSQELLPVGRFEILKYGKELEEDFEDLQFGQITKLKYHTRGPLEFKPYREYQIERRDK